MGVHIPNGYGLASFRFTCAGVLDHMFTTVGFSWDPLLGANAAFPDLIAATIKDKATAAGKVWAADRIAVGWSLLSVEVMVRDDGGLAPGVAPANIIGAAGVNPLPPNCAVLVKKNTGRSGRKGRGRMYLPPFQVSEGNVDSGGVITNVALPGMQTAIELFRTDMNTANYPLHLLHGDDTDTPNLITSLQISPLLATQRRRMR